MNSRVLFGLPIILALLLFFGQHCANNVSLEQLSYLNLSSLQGSPFKLPRSQFTLPRRYIFLIDMSHSMLSGTCAQDLDGGTLFTNTNPFIIYDPNFPTGGYGNSGGDPTDHRASGIDCIVDPIRPLSGSPYFSTPTISVTGNWGTNFLTSFYTVVGVDYLPHSSTGLAYRIQMVYNSVTTLLNQNGTNNNIKIMIIPVTGGANQKILESFLPPTPSTPKGGISFVKLSDQDATGIPLWQSTLASLNSTQIKNELAAEARTDLIMDGMASYPNGTPYAYRFKDTTMGTTDLGSTLKKIYSVVYNDMVASPDYYPEYQIIHLTDGYLTPQQNHFDLVMNMYTPPNGHPCITSDLLGSDPTCTQLNQLMLDTWGEPSLNSSRQISTNYGMTQSLSEYFGGGYARVDMVQLNSPRATTLFASDTNYISDLSSNLQSRQYIWQQDMTSPAAPPYPLLDSNELAYKVTHAYIFNLNVRVDQHGDLQVDSAGDGAFDSDKIAAGLDPYNPRSNGVCLNAITLNPSFQARCQELGQLLISGSELGCDPQLDSDGDGLNECEEKILGTDLYNFDSDEDSIPDFLELVYGFNANKSDAKLDSNSDSIPNLVNFASGLGPMSMIKHVPLQNLISYNVNSLASGETQILVNHIPSKNGLKVTPTVFTNLSSWVTAMNFQNSTLGKNYSTFHSAPILQMYSDRSHIHAIPYSQQLFTFNSDTNQNNLLGLIRTVSESDSSQVKWWIYKRAFTVGGTISNSQLSLSLFEPIFNSLDKGGK